MDREMLGKFYSQKLFGRSPHLSRGNRFVGVMNDISIVKQR